MTKPKPRGKAAAPAPTSAPAPGKMTPRSIDVFRQDRSLMQLDNLFVLGGGDDRKRSQTIELKDGALVVEYTSMSGYDMRVLCVVTALLNGISRGEVSAFQHDDDSAEAAAAWEALGENARMAQGIIGVLRTSRRQIASMLATGEKQAKDVGARQLDAVMESLWRLGGIRVHFMSNNKRREIAMPLIGGFTREDNTLRIVINPRLANAVMGRLPGAFLLLSMHNLRALTTEVSLLLYYRLCAVINEGGRRRLSEETLIRYVWGGAPEAATKDEARETLKMRRRSLLKAIGALENLTPAWEFESPPAGRGMPRMWVIRRPSQDERSAAYAQRQLSLDLIGPTPVAGKAS